MVNPIPENYPRVMPYLYVDGAKAAIDFYTSVIGAEVRMTMPGPGGRVGHAELSLGDSVIMLADEFPDMGVRGPKSMGGTPVAIHVYVEDVDATSTRPSALELPPCVRWRTSSTATGAASSRTPSVTVGALPRTPRI
jgi:PhnB protein